MSYNPTNANGQATMANSAPVVIASDQFNTFTNGTQIATISGAVSVVGLRPYSSVITITRPSNTTAYSAGQVVSTAISGLTAFPTMAIGVGNTQKIIINNVSIISSNGGAATKGQFAVYLFNAASPSGGGFNDAAAFAPTAAAFVLDGNSMIGQIPSLLPNTGSASYGYILTNDTRQATTDSSGNLYPAIILTNAYTPASGETITLRISGTY